MTELTASARLSAAKTRAPASRASPSLVVPATTATFSPPSSESFEIPGWSICESVTAVATNAIREEVITSETSIQPPVIKRPARLLGTRSP